MTPSFAAVFNLRCRSHLHHLLAKFEFVSQSSRVRETTRSNHHHLTLNVLDVLSGTPSATSSLWAPDTLPLVTTNTAYKFWRDTAKCIMSVLLTPWGMTPKTFLKTLAAVWSQPTHHRIMFATINCVNVRPDTPIFLLNAQRKWLYAFPDTREEVRWLSPLGSGAYPGVSAPTTKALVLPTWLCCLKSATRELSTMQPNFSSSIPGYHSRLSDLYSWYNLLVRY